MSEWREMAIEELASDDRYAVVGGPFGSSLGRKDYEPEGVPVIRGAQLGGSSAFSHDNLVFVSEVKAQHHRGNLAYPGDVIVTQRGSIGQVGLIPRDSPYPEYLLSQSQMKISVDRDQVDERFLYYSLRSPEGQHRLISSTISSGVPHINLGMLRRLRLRVPMLEIQRRIADILEAIDHLIENNSKRSVILQEISRAIYREWFVEFQYPGHEAVWTVESELGPIPEGWEVRRLGEAIELLYGKALTAESRMGGHVPVYGSSGIVGWHDSPLVDNPGIVVGRKGNVGSIFWSAVPFFPIDTTYYVRTALPTAFVFQLLQGVAFIDSHAAVPGLNRDQAYGLPIVVPPRGLIDKFVDIVAPIFTLKYEMNEAASALVVIRDLLLPRLTSGQVDVSMIELPKAV